MNRTRAGSVRFLVLGGAVFTLLVSNFAMWPASIPRAADSRSVAALPAAARLEAYGRLPLVFEANTGQTDPKVRFLARARGMTVFFTGTEAVMVLRRSRPTELPARDGPSREHQRVVESAVLRLRLAGARAPARAVGLQPTGGISNYFIGNDPRGWRTDIPHYRRVEYQGVYPGVDVAYYGREGKLEYDLVVAPGADPARIELAFEGAETVEVNAEGDLVLGTRLGPVVQKRPRVYQDLGGRRVEVAASYRVRGQRATFELARYDRSQLLVIDPALAYSTYLGGSGGEYGSGIAVDSAGAAYVTGGVASTNFPTQSAYQSDQGGDDVFVSKLSSAGNALVYSTYLGGSNHEFGRAIAVDSLGAAYVTGQTLSANFPTLLPYQTSQGNRDVFVTKLVPAGNALLYSTYLGGNGTDYTWSIAVDGAGAAYVTGGTASTNFPTQSPFQTNQGGDDVFVTKLSPAGNALVYSTYLGGSISDDAGGIAVDSTGAAYVTGYTISGDFPTQSPYQSGHAGGGYDVFVTKLSPAGNTLLYSTYLGGNANDYSNGIAVDSTGAAYVTGYTLSANFPTQSPYQTYQGVSDVFVTKLSPTGNALMYSTYLGGSGNDNGRGIAVDGAWAAYVTGLTDSTNFPTQSPYQTYRGVSDVFVTKLSPPGNALLYSTYLGGSNAEGPEDIAVDSSGAAYVTGETYSIDFPTESLYQTDQDGTDVFVTKLAATSRTPGVVSVSPAAGSGAAQSFTFTFTDPDGWQDLGVVNVLVNFWLDGRNSCYLAYSRLPGVLYLVNDFGADLLPAMMLGGSGSVSNSQCTIFSGGSSASGSGNTLTLTLNMSFSTAFYPDTKIVYLAARDAAENNSGWQRMGIWKVPGGASTSPAVVSMSPARGSSAGPTSIILQFSDSDGWQDLSVLNILVNEWLDGRHACYLAYSHQYGVLFLVNDDGTGLLPGLVLTPGGGSVANSQCTVSASTASVSGSGSTLTLTLSMSFPTGFAGNRVFYLAARDVAEHNSGWQAMGTWRVP